MFSVASGLIHPIEEALMRVAVAAVVTMIFALGALGTGCAGSGGSSNSGTSTGKWTHVIARDEPYYFTGPQQGRPPDGHFVAGTHVRILGDGGSYSRVESEDGITAWVSKSAVQPDGARHGRIWPDDGD
jgi:hypothetical protein